MNRIKILLWLLMAVFFAPGARAAVTLTTLHSFTGPEGANPVGLIQGSDGNFYGRTEYGGAGFNGRNQTGYGTIFKMSPDGTLTNLYRFDESVGHYWPVGGLVEGEHGVFYGATTKGGVADDGTMFSITSSGEFTTLTSLAAGAATSTFTRGQDGNFYTMAIFGGEYGLGTLFRVTPQGSVNVLVSFDGTNGFTGWFANALVQGADGNFYGTTQLGGPAYGTIFKVTADGRLSSCLISPRSPSKPRSATRKRFRGSGASSRTKAATCWSNST